MHKHAHKSSRTCPSSFTLEGYKCQHSLVLFIFKHTEHRKCNIFELKCHCHYSLDLSNELVIASATKSHSSFAEKAKIRGETIGNQQKKNLNVVNNHNLVMLYQITS